MGALPKPDLQPGPKRELNDALHALHHRAGWPSLRNLASIAGCSHTTVSHVFSSPKPSRWGVIELLVEAMGGDTADFHRLWLSASSPASAHGHVVHAIAGRQTELAAVRLHLETGAGLLLVTGEAGIGKTKLAATAVVRAAADIFVATGIVPAAVVRGAADADGGRVSLGLRIRRRSVAGRGLVAVLTICGRLSEPSRSRARASGRARRLKPRPMDRPSLVLSHRSHAANPRIRGSSNRATHRGPPLGRHHHPRSDRTPRRSPTWHANARHMACWTIRPSARSNVTWFNRLRRDVVRDDAPTPRRSAEPRPTTSSPLLTGHDVSFSGNPSTTIHSPYAGATALHRATGRRSSPRDGPAARAPCRPP